jgi:hypothetical protein
MYVYFVIPSPSVKKLITVKSMIGFSFGINIKTNMLMIQLVILLESLT